MNFRNEYGEYSAQEAVDAILVILKKHGIEIDDKSFTWTLVGERSSNEFTFLLKITK